MAVSLEARLLAKISSIVENADETTKTTLDHVKRIFSDHDYLKHPAPDEENNEKTSIVMDEPHVGQKKVQSYIQDHSGACSSHDSKVEKAGELPNDGIQANDLCSLLDKFEEAIGNSPCILTPATSPGRSENWSEPLSLKINPHVNATDLTPPTTPPIQDQAEQKHISNCCKPSAKQKKQTSKLPMKKNAVNKSARKVEGLKHKTINKTSKTPSVVSKNVQQKTAKVAIAEHAKQGIKLAEIGNNVSKRKCEDTTQDTVKELLNVHDVTEKKLPQLNSNKDNNEVHNNNNNQIELKVDTCRTVNNNNNLPNVEKTENKECSNDSHIDDHNSKKRDIEENSKRKTERYNEVYKDDRKKRKHRSRSTSTDEDVSEDERYNPRRSDHYHESVKHSHDSTRRKEKYRKYSSRDDYEERRHRKYDDHRHRKPREYVRDIERERKIDFRLGRSNIRDVAKEERRVVYVGGLPYGTTRDELWNRFRKFGPIEKITVHLRVGERDNYGFVTFLEPEDARECIERGNSDPTEPQFDLCFGGRRQFCGGSYVDFDSSTSHIEELSEAYGKVCDEIPEEDDFDSLLRMCQEGLGR